MKRIAIYIFMILGVLTIGVILGYQLRNHPSYWQTATFSSHANIEATQEAALTINDEIDAKIDSLFGADSHRDIILVVSPELGGYSIEAHIPHFSKLSKQSAKDQLIDWISFRMTELQKEYNNNNPIEEDIIWSKP